MKNAIGFFAFALVAMTGCITSEVTTEQTVVAGASQTVPAMVDTVTFKTSKGEIVIELDREKAPITVDNFVQYAKEGFYDNVIFHRVIDGFMIQGGGFTADMGEKPTRPAIRNEAVNGLKNLRGTVAMARTPNPHSASAQFFINLKDNAFLDYTAPTPSGYGYCVFGKVIRGMDVVDAIAKVPTGYRNGHGDVPREPITILSVSLD